MSIKLKFFRIERQVVGFVYRVVELLLKVSMLPSYSFALLQYADNQLEKSPAVYPFTAGVIRGAFYAQR